MFSKITPKVANYRFSKHTNFFWLDSISCTIKPHVHRLGTFLLNFSFHDSNTGSIVDVYDCGRLRISHLDIVVIKTMDYLKLI